jgi:hypothetical protein
VINKRLKTEFNTDCSEQSLFSAISFLDGSYSKTSAPGTKLAVRNCNTLKASEALSHCLKINGFKESMKDCIDCGLKIYKRKYANSGESPFTLYERYGRYDVIRLLNFKERIVAQNIGGYFANKDLHVCPIFVTYQKSSEINQSVQYEDRFIDYETFSWFSKNKRTINSPDVQEIMNPLCKSYLFVQKGDDDTSDFYYLGRVRPIKDEIQEGIIHDDKGKPLSIVNMILSLDDPVPDKIYVYLTS